MFSGVNERRGMGVSTEHDDVRVQLSFVVNLCIRRVFGERVQRLKHASNDFFVKSVDEFTRLATGLLASEVHLESINEFLRRGTVSCQPNYRHSAHEGQNTTASFYRHFGLDNRADLIVDE